MKTWCKCTHERLYYSLNEEPKKCQVCEKLIKPKKPPKEMTLFKKGGYICNLLAFFVSVGIYICAIFIGVCYYIKSKVGIK